MEVRDGFIDSIFNYCDRWCETCPYTSWCRLFADVAELDASLDPQLKAVAEAPPLPQEIKDMPPWMQERLEEIQAAIEKTSKEALAPDDDEDEELEPPPLPKEDPLMQHAVAYSMIVHDWLDGFGSRHGDPNDPRAVIGWYGTMIPSKLARALGGIGFADPGDEEEPTDYDGSAKVALISIERSRGAWQQIAAAEPSCATPGPAVAELNWLEQEVERMFPKARRFVRPAFDEPDEVARLLGERNESTSG